MRNSDFGIRTSESGKARTLIAVIVVISAVILFAAAKQKEKYTFRKTCWGMSMAQVVASEKAKRTDTNVSLLCVDAKCLVFEEAQMGIDCRIFYRFKQGALVDGGYYYRFTDDKAGKIYKQLKEKYKVFYGKPVYPPYGGEKKTESNEQGKIIIMNAYYKGKDTAVNIHSVEFPGDKHEITVFYYDANNEKTRAQLKFLFDDKKKKESELE